MEISEKSRKTIVSSCNSGNDLVKRFSRKVAGLEYSDSRVSLGSVELSATLEDIAFLRALPSLKWKSDEHSRVFEMFRSGWFERSSTDEIISCIIGKFASFKALYISCLKNVVKENSERAKLRERNKQKRGKREFKTSRSKFNAPITPIDGKLGYKKYLESDRWSEFRKTILELRGRKCQLCGATSNIQVHHMTYKRVQNEDVRDVLVVCGSCHVFIHTEH